MSVRAEITVHGAVQGVGFRPFVFRLANDLGVTGWVMNTPHGVLIEAEAAEPTIEQFILRLDREKPSNAFIQSLETRLLDPLGLPRFEIRKSDEQGQPSAFVLPDIATCPACLSELRDPANRRHRYPFTNCTHCGPRFSIIEALPYDRPNTSMRRFTMCPDCQREYDDPADRRFHAQPNACPVCGPTLTLRAAEGTLLLRGDDALREAERLILAGMSIAAKGIGGFHLIVDARNEAAVRRLRARKKREEKPFAVMTPDLAAARALCHVDELEARLLTSPQAPIVLLRKRSGPAMVAGTVAPGNPALGIMLPYSPLHHLLLSDLGFAVVATSGNISDEPICIDEDEALHRLAGIADAFLVHDRPIIRHIDDSVTRVSLGRELVLRRARGYAPLPVALGRDVPDMLAVGAHLKNTIAVARHRHVFVSQHIGDLNTIESYRTFREEVGNLRRLYHIQPTLVVSDRHPDYLSTTYAHESGLPVLAFQHHYAHIASCMAENELEGQVLGVCWDGTGYGDDGTVWGGEFLVTNATGFHRTATFRRFRLPGGEAAVREPRRSAMGILHEIYGSIPSGGPTIPSVRSCTPVELAIIGRMVQQGVNSPYTSSVGRLFDAVASLIGVRQVSTYEGQAAMELEYVLADYVSDDSYPFTVTGPRVPGDAGPLVIDWQPAVSRILSDVQEGRPAGMIAALFHNMLVEVIVAVARRVGEKRVALSGGCFQNRYLTERAVLRLRSEGFRPYWHQRIPPNDGGISLGQIYAAARASDPGSSELRTTTARS